MPNLRRTRTPPMQSEVPSLVKMEDSPERIQNRDNLNAVHAIVLCTIWCSISVVNNIISKTLLNSFPYPLTLTMAQLLATASCAEPVVRLWKIPHIHWEKIDHRYTLVTIIPLGVGKFLAACGTHISVSKLPVSYAHTVKATMPIFVVILSTLIFKESYSIEIYGALFVIFLGVGVASTTELEFDSLGLVSALLATLAFALINILTKKCLNYTHMHQFRLLLMLGRISSLMFFPIWVYNDVFFFLNAHKPLSAHFGMPFTVLLLVSDGVLNFSQNLIAFTLIAKVSPVSYAVCNVVKRIAVIVLSILFFRNPVTSVNIAGTFTAIFGVFLYNMVKNKHKPASLVLPMHSKSRFTDSLSDSCTIFMGEGPDSPDNLPLSKHLEHVNGDITYTKAVRSGGGLKAIASDESLCSNDNISTKGTISALETTMRSPSRAFANDDSRTRRVSNSSTYFNL